MSIKQVKDLHQEMDALYGPLLVTNPSNGGDYYCDNNAGDDTKDGSSWANAVKTFAQATTLINAREGANNWAARCRLFYKADTETATLVAFPNKTDVIGVGSYDANTKPGISGNHAPVNAGNYGTRFINMWFKGVAAATPIVDLASTSSGIQFIGCTFDGVAGTLTYAIRATASPFLKVINCDIFGTYATGYIAFGTGDTAGTVVDGNLMHGCAGLGIATVTGTTSSYQTFIKNNIISVTSTGVCIDDEANGGAGILYCIDNRFLNAATLTNYAGVAGILDVNIARCLNNMCMGADVGFRYPVITA